MAEEYPLHSPSAPPELSLDERSADEWERLRIALNGPSEFWVAFLFPRSETAAQAFRQLSQGELDLQRRSFVRIPTPTPDTLVRSTGELLRPPAVTAGCIWIEAIGMDPPGEPTRWKNAWDQVFHKLEERRDLLRRRLMGGLVLVANECFRKDAEFIAPQLWAKRTLAADRLSAQRLVRGAPILPSPSSDKQTVAEPLPSDLMASVIIYKEQPRPTDAEVAHAIDQAEKSAQAERTAKNAIPASRPNIRTALTQDIAIPPSTQRGPSSNPPQSETAEDEATASLRRGVEVLVRAGQFARAADHASILVVREKSRTVPSPYRLTESLALLAEAELACDRIEEGLVHLKEALHYAGDRCDISVLKLLQTAASVESQLDHRDEAIGFLEQAVEVGNRLWKDNAESVEAAEALLEALIARGDVCMPIDAAWAEDSFSRAYTASRVAQRRFGATELLMTQEFVSLQRLGDVRRGQGRLADAKADFQACLSVAWQRVGRYGDSPGTLRMLSVAQNRLGDLALEEGDAQGAVDLFTEALEIRQRVVATYGETDERRQDVERTEQRLERAKRLLGVFKR